MASVYLQLYEFYLETISKNGRSAPSLKVEAQTKGRSPVNAPHNLTVHVLGETNSVLLQWVPSIEQNPITVRAGWMTNARLARF